MTFRKFEAKRLDHSTAVRRLLAEGLEAWRTGRALEQYTKNDLSLSKAAELAECSVWDFTRLVEESDTAWVSSDHLEADLEELRSGFSTPSRLYIWPKSSGSNCSRHSTGHVSSPKQCTGRL